MTRTRLASLLATGALLIGALSIVGWLGQVQVPALAVLYHPFGSTVPMAFFTACMFVAAAGIVIGTSRVQLGHRRYSFVAVCSAGVLLTCASTASPYLRSYQPPATDIEVPPALATLFCFALIALAGLSMDQRTMAKWAGGVAAAMGLSALVGYALNVPLMYWELPSYSVGMAPNTALAFVLLGLGMLVAPRPEEP